MELRRVKFNQKPALLISGIMDAETMKQLQAIAPVVLVNDGFIVQVEKGPVFERIRSLCEKTENQRRWQREMTIRERKIEAWKAYMSDTEEARAYADQIKKQILDHQPIACQSAADFLMNHQKAGVLISEKFPKYAFYYDTGTGKTLLALQIIRNKIRNDGAVFLVLCPKSIIHAAWLDDCSRFFPDLKLMPLNGNYTTQEYQNMHFRWGKANSTSFAAPPRFYVGSAKERTEYAKSYIAAEAECYIVNPERFIRTPESFLHIQTADGVKHINGIVVDESARLKNPDAVLTKTLQEVAPNLDYLYLLSGKPAPNRIAEYLSQIELLAPLSIPPGYMTKMMDSETPAYKLEMTKIINCASVTVAKKDCFDLPAATEIIREIELGEAVLEKYRDLKYRMRTEIESFPEQERTQKNLIFVNHVLASIAKLRELTGGFVYDGKTAIPVHNDKVNEVLDLLDELGDEQILIWCQYRYEIELLQKVLQDHGYTVKTAYAKTKDLNDSIYSFKNGNAQVLIAHPRTLQYGVTLVNCCYALYYSTSYSYEEYYQSHDRIYRKGQTRPCTYIFLQCVGTIDRVMFDTIINKQTQTEMIERAIKHIYGG